MPEEDPPDAWARRTSKAIAQGSREALGDLYQRRFDLLYRTVRQRTGCDEHVALDCVQDGMLKVAASLGSHESAATLDAWLRRTVLSAALDRLRRERSRSRREESRALDPEAARSDQDGEGVDLDRLRAQIESLHAEERALLDFRFRRGLTLVQVGDASGLAPKAVDSRIRRTLARLRIALGGSPPIAPSLPEPESNLARKAGGPTS